MISGIQVLLALIVSIVIIVRWRLVPLPASLRQRIHDELNRHLEISSPHLRSTFDAISFGSGTSTSH